MVTFILFVIIVLFVIFFSIQNAIPVTIYFLFWRFEASLAIVIFLAVIAGILIAFLFFLWRKITKKDTIKEYGSPKNQNTGHN